MARVCGNGLDHRIPQRTHPDRQVIPQDAFAFRHEVVQVLADPSLAGNYQDEPDTLGTRLGDEQLEDRLGTFGREPVQIQGAFRLDPPATDALVQLAVQLRG